MTRRLPFEMLDEPSELARYQGWTEEVYADLLAVRSGRMSQDDFDRKYLKTKAVLVLDLTGFTENAMHGGSLKSFVRILDAHRMFLPIMRQCNADFVRTFADDIVALFREPGDALDAALLVHRRCEEAVESATNPDDVPECCIGIGYGAVYGIGDYHAMGDPMNRASKLGEDIARGGETLITLSAYRALKTRDDVDFQRLESDDQLFPYYRVEQR